MSELLFWGQDSKGTGKSHVVMGHLPSSSLDDFSGLETDTVLPTEEDYVVYDDGMETISFCFLITRSYFSYKSFFMRCHTLLVPGRR